MINIRNIKVGNKVIYSPKRAGKIPSSDWAFLEGRRGTIKKIDIPDKEVSILFDGLNFLKYPSLSNLFLISSGHILTSIFKNESTIR